MKIQEVSGGLLPPVCSTPETIGTIILAAIAMYLSRRRTSFRMISSFR